MNILVTGSSGLIGSEAVQYYDSAGHIVFGIDNNMRREFFGPKGDTTWNLQRLQKITKRFTHYDMDIRSRNEILNFFKQQHFDVVIHCAAQPSHDRAAVIPFEDFDVNAVGTLNLLEATRRYNPNAVFIHLSTNKVYGDAPNEVPLVELETRYDYALPDNYHGINEECRIDRSLHSLFGASKLAADVLAQEFGKYFGMKVGIFRGGCLTGPNHSGVELHGFLSYLVHVAVTGKSYTIFGYKGKQVRDQIHSFDVIRAFDEFIKKPKPGEVYNIGGGRENAASILECIEMVSDLTGHRVDFTYVEKNRIGDHICYITDLRKFKQHFPTWKITYSLEDIIREMVMVEQQRHTLSH
ncbi:MAG: NAD-dependent epimerase/dehydratase family protein [Candidatus Nitrosotenuis sp.]